MSCNIVINQQPFLPTPAPKTKSKDQKRVEAAHRGRKTIRKKLKERFPKNNQEAQMTLKKFIDYFQQGLNDPASTLIAIEETMHIIIYWRN